jgi:sugar phosphate isomerase/epimerase
VALSRDSLNWVSQAGIALLLAIAALNSFFGQLAVKLGHDYYRNIRASKTTLEKALRLDAHAIVTTPGMRREHDVAPQGTPEASSHRSARITLHARWLLGVIGVASGLGAAFAAYASIVAPP